jgi:hypothetical protein
MAVLKLVNDNRSREIEFELDFLLSLTTQQRFDMMLRKSRQMKALSRKNGRRKTAEVIKRT